MARVGLMGFGRIGRNVFRLLDAAGEIDVAAIADTADPAALEYLLKYDSIYGRFPKPVELEGPNLVVDGTRIPFVDGVEPGEASRRANVDRDLRDRQDHEERHDRVRA